MQYPYKDDHMLESLFIRTKYFIYIPQKHRTMQVFYIEEKEAKMSSCSW